MRKEEAALTPGAACEGGRASSHRRAACRAPRGGGAPRRRRGTAPVMRVGRSPCALRPERRCGELKPISARRSTCSRAAGGAPPLASVPIEGRVAIPRTVAWSAVSRRSHHASVIGRVDLNPPHGKRPLITSPLSHALASCKYRRVRSFGLTPRPTRAPRIASAWLCTAARAAHLLLASHTSISIPIDVMTSASASPVQRPASSSSRHCL